MNTEILKATYYLLKAKALGENVGLTSDMGFVWMGNSQTLGL